MQVNGRPYRGAITALRDRTGVTVVDRVPMEAYLVGVISAEMGRRSAVEQEALRAQAIVSRTFALRNLRRWEAQGFDALRHRGRPGVRRGRRPRRRRAGPPSRPRVARS